MADSDPAIPARHADGSRRLLAAAHELRNPLNTILAWAQVLEQSISDAPPQVDRALAGIRDGVAKQVRLIEELLELAKPPAGGGGA